jgi:thiol-disulfide isomerase/thioredoxin
VYAVVEGDRMARRAVLLIGVILIAGLSLLAVLKHRRSNHEALRVNGGTAAPSPGSQDDGTADLMGVDLRGKPAPGFTLMDVSGKKVSLADYKGLAVIVNFWATYCGPCKLEMPWFEQLQAKYKDQGLVILGIDQDEGMPQRDVANAAKHAGVSYPILMPEATISKEYGGVDYLPETFYIDRDGNVLLQTAGAPTREQIEANIRHTLAVGSGSM